jgi:hypothetical protein
VDELTQRDRNIAALRKLLVEKKAKLSGEDMAPPTPQKAIDYEKMGLDVLKRLDKARDATIAAILRQMDKLDEDLKLLDGLADDALDDLDETNVPGDAQAKEADALSDVGKAAGTGTEGIKDDAGHPGRDISKDVQAG